MCVNNKEEQEELIAGQKLNDFVFFLNPDAASLEFTITAVAQGTAWQEECGV